MPVQEAQDIFGDADELLEEFRAHPHPGQQESFHEEDDLDAEDLGDDDEARADRLQAIVSLPANCAYIPMLRSDQPFFLPRCSRSAAAARFLAETTPLIQDPAIWLTWHCASSSCTA